MLHRSDLWLLFAGLVASVFNAAAGGGTLLSFPMLLAAGLAPIAANATSTVGLLPGTLASVATYRVELHALRREVVRALAPSLAGGALGAWLLVALGARVFEWIVPVLLVGSAALLLLQPLVVRRLAVHHAGRESAAGVVGANFLISIYWGYFGAGAGILFLGAMGVLVRRSLGQVNALKVFVNVVSNAVAACAFVLLERLHPTGALSLRAAAPLMVGAIAGGWLGVRVARRLPAAALRGFAAAVGLGMALYLILR